jgi:allophanate hydrolase subunit 2
MKATGTALAAAPPAAALKPATDHEMRSKFLNMIGVDPKPLPPTVENQVTKMQNLSTSVSSSTAWVNPRGKVASYHESLKYDPHADKMYSKKRKTATSVVPEKPKKSLLFNETVEVVPIPMRTEYSSRVRSRMWSNAYEIHSNAARNTVEFAAEG